MPIFLRIELEGQDQWFEYELPDGSPLPQEGGCVYLHPGNAEMGTPVLVLERHLHLHPVTHVIESVMVKVRPPDSGAEAQ